LIVLVTSSSTMRSARNAASPGAPQLARWARIFSLAGLIAAKLFSIWRLSRLSILKLHTNDREIVLQRLPAAQFTHPVQKPPEPVGLQPMLPHEAREVGKFNHRAVNALDLVSAVAKNKQAVPGPHLERLRAIDHV